MADYDFAAGLPDFDWQVMILNVLRFGTVAASSGTEIVLMSGTTQLVIEGSGLHENGGVIDAGTISAIQLIHTVAPTLVVTIDNFVSTPNAVDLQSLRGLSEQDTRIGLYNFGSVESLHVNGSDDAETLVGGSQSDTFDGNDGQDNFLPGEGNDLVDGGDGHDNVNYNDASGSPTHGAIVNLSGTAIDGDVGDGTHTVAAGHALDNWDDTDTLLNIEGINGSGFRDWIVGGDQDNAFGGNGGDDLIVGGRGSDFILGGEGDDDLRGDNEDGSGQDADGDYEGDDYFEDTLSYSNETGGAGISLDVALGGQPIPMAATTTSMALRCTSAALTATPS